MRAEIAHGKAYGALRMGMGSRALFQRAQEQAYFIDAVNTMAKAAGAGPRRRADQDGGRCSALSDHGDTSDNDEACAVAGIEESRLSAGRGLKEFGHG